ncbi:unnamed protein product [Orchesella dallaii]|uniref:Chitin-binding type-4 domain-containing protein n=1 Tax=Orchesella dallaii TaxID=48710 RepID=A0ABP1RFC6_9HEXA
MRAVTLFFCALALATVEGHMRMLEPPSRTSMWRFEEFAYLNPEQTATDDEFWCANIRQFESDERCGICGDPVADPTPRAAEYRGRFWRDVSVRTFTAGQTIPIHLESYAPHGGGVEVHFCDTVPETEGCFRKLVLGNGDTFWPMRLGDGDFDIQTTAKLPDGVTCEHCVIRMHYRGAQHWGNCDSSRTCECDPNSGNPPGGMGCSEQQTFRACADITIR